MNLSLGRIKGVKIQVHFTFWLIVIWWAFQDGAYGVLRILLLFGIVLLHELGHSLAALRFGIPVRDITLLPIGGLARLERMPDKPFQEFIVAVAGPAVNLVLAVVLFPVVWLVAGGKIFWPGTFYQALTGSSLLGIVVYLFVANLTLLVFNMMPAFPLDGGRVFRALLAMVLGNETATRIAVWVGRSFAILLGGYALFKVNPNPFLAIIALFIFSAGGAEGRAIAIKRKLRRISVRQALSRVGSTVLQPHVTMMEVASLTLHSHQSNFPVMLEDVLLGVLRRKDIRHALERGERWATVSEVMKRDVPKINVDAP
ncbi:MAG: site-2 protease family protein, partial [Anaerolineae bacterium]